MSYVKSQVPAKRVWIVYYGHEGGSYAEIHHIVECTDAKLDALITILRSRVDIVNYPDAMNYWAEPQKLVASKNMDALIAEQQVIATIERLVEKREL